MNYFSFVSLGKFLCALFALSLQINVTMWLEILHVEQTRTRLSLMITDTRCSLLFTSFYGFDLLIYGCLTLTLALVHPASSWMYWATLRHHSGLFRAATSSSSQVSPTLTSPCWLCSSSWYADDVDLSWTRESPSAAPVEVCTVGPCVSHAQASLVYFRWVYHPCSIAQFWLWPLCLLFYPSSRCPRCSFAIYDEQHSVFSSLLLLHFSVSSAQKLLYICIWHCQWIIVI